MTSGRGAESFRVGNECFRSAGDVLGDVSEMSMVADLIESAVGVTVIGSGAEAMVCYDADAAGISAFLERSKRAKAIAGPVDGRPMAMCGLHPEPRILQDDSPWSLVGTVGTAAIQ
jgi:hypothetical protein